MTSEQQAATCPTGEEWDSDEGECIEVDSGGWYGSLRDTVYDFLP